MAHHIQIKDAKISETRLYLGYYIPEKLNKNQSLIMREAIFAAQGELSVTDILDKYENDIPEIGLVYFHIKWFSEDGKLVTKDVRLSAPELKLVDEKDIQ